MAVLLQTDLNSVADWQTKSKEFKGEKDGDQHLKPAGTGRLEIPLYRIYLDHKQKDPIGHALLLKVTTSPEAFTK